MGLRVAVTRQIPDPGVPMVAAVANDLWVNPEDRVLTHQELLDCVRGRDGVLCLLTDRMDVEVMEAAEGCRIFANYAVGFDNVDVAEATKRGILVTNTPGVLTDATADHAWALLFAATRRIAEADRYMRSGAYQGWGPMLFLGGDVTGRTLGIIGAGRIGSAVARKSVGFSMRVLYHDALPNSDLEREIGAQRVDLDTLLMESDFVSVHVNLSTETHHLLGAREFSLMKPTAYLVNTSRGPIVDEAALVEALRDGQIAGAALDVFEDEPKMKPGMAELTNVVVVPHIASATHWTRSKMAEMAAANLLAALKGERPPNLVNPAVLEHRK